MTDNDQDGICTVTPASSGADPATVFTALAEILYGGADASEVYSAICVAATLLVPGCDHASVMLRRNGEFVLGAASDDVAAAIDAHERHLGQGPCLDAIEEEVPQIEADLRTGSSWPALARAVVESTPVRGAMGFRLLIDRRKIGALNLFSDTPGAFTSAAAEHASMLAAFASVTATAIGRGEDIDSLRSGLVSNREIGKAVGLVMAAQNLSADEAFDLLRRTSQQVNLKVADLARTVVENHSVSQKP